MFKISILTLFPNSINWIKDYSIVKRAVENKKVDLQIVNFREWSKNKNFSVDDAPYGGGPGMVIGLQSICDCLNEIRTQSSLVYLLTPMGQTYNQDFAKDIIKKTNHIILICGHYEGIDYRIKNYIDGMISIGDYILTGGEIPALAIIDSLTRLIDGVINKESLLVESFTENLLDYPVYTRPENFDGNYVPKILLSGNHEKIKDWRQKQQILLTKKYRPDLFKKFLNSRKEK